MLTAVSTSLSARLNIYKVTKYNSTNNNTNKIIMADCKLEQNFLCLNWVNGCSYTLQVDARSTKQLCFNLSKIS